MTNIFDTESAADLKRAIRAITVDMPDDKPNGESERLLVAIEHFVVAWKPVDKTDETKLRELAGLFAQLCEESAADTAALRMAAEGFFKEDFSSPAEGEPPPIEDADFFIDSWRTDKYASWCLMLFRLPAVLKIKFDAFTKDYKLFCTYEGQRYRVTGASRLGDVWLSKDFAREDGYEARVSVAACSGWGATP